MYHILSPSGQMGAFYIKLILKTVFSFIIPSSNMWLILTKLLFTIYSYCHLSAVLPYTYLGCQNKLSRYVYHHATITANLIKRPNYDRNCVVSIMSKHTTFSIRYIKKSMKVITRNTNLLYLVTKAEKQCDLLL